MTWRPERATWIGAGLAGVALALRVAHVLTTAKLLVADDAVFFEQHAMAFVEAWRAVGRPEFGELLREAVDHASLQGVVYPLFLSGLYGLRGGIDHTAAALVQAVLGAGTVWLVYLTARRAFGDVAGWVAGVASALYPPFILTAGLLLAEAVLLFLQSLAAYLAVRGAGAGAGVSVGLLMLRPAFQHAGLLTLLGLVRRRDVAMRFVAGLLIVAVPWLLVNGLVFDKLVWSRTGDAWQQIYWGIYPPNRGWWPPDSPVPPKYGVESLPGARSAGRVIEERSLDYLEAAIDQVRATPLQALATEVNKLAHGYEYVFNTYAEYPPLVAALAVPLHRGIAWLALIGAALAYRRAAPALALGGLALGVSLPFLVSHIDLRYVIPIALAALPFAGHGASELLRSARQASAVTPSIAAGALVLASQLDVPALLAPLPSLDPLVAHRIQTALVVLCFVALGATLGAWIGARATLMGAAVSVALVYALHAFYEPGWREWSTQLRPGEWAVQRISLPPGWTPPGGARAEVRLYAAGAREHTYTPVLSANGREVARLGPAFTEGGPLRFEERVMVAASRQGRARADVPQWYGTPLDLSALAGGSVELRLGLEGAPETWVRLWGDYVPSSAERALEAPAIHSRIQGQDDSFQKFVATGHGRLWRRVPLASASTSASRERSGVRIADDLSDSLGRQTGAFRMRVLIFSSSGELLAIF